MSKIIFKIEGGEEKILTVDDGANLLELAQGADIPIDAPCSGNGQCGKCRVRISTGNVKSEKSRHISSDEWDKGWRLACISQVEGDAEIIVPAGAGAFKKGIQTADLSTAEELKRYEDAVKEIFDSGVSRGCAEKGYGIAVDIGTTTVTAALLNLADGTVLAKESAGNGQIRYGADVINRIISSSRPGGREALQSAVREETLSPMVEEMCKNAGIDKNEVTRVVIAGNTTMEHLFVGEDAESIRLEPYVPAFLELHGKTGADVGLPVNPEAKIIFAPNVGSYVGGDITAGALTTMLWNSPEISLFVDLGTNGELVFGNSDFMLCCACSAGPAFEGGDISCGMRATKGAIEACTIDADSMEPTLTIVGPDGTKPAGLCGSGLIDVISELFRTGIINAKGKFVKTGDRVRYDEYGGEYVLAFAADSMTGRDVTINETDLDNFIRAKGAIFSAIRSMLSSVDMSVEDIDKVMIAGGIGSGISIDRAIKIGMLPKIPIEKYAYIGNSSLTGACAMLLSDDATERVMELGRNMTYLELSTHPGYMDEFVAACFLPHTNASLFE